MRPCGAFGLPNGGIPPPVPPAPPPPIGSTGFGSVSGPPFFVVFLPIALPVLPSFTTLTSPLFQAGDSRAFTQSNGILKYIGTTPTIFQVDAQVSMLAAGGGELTSIVGVFMAIAKNGFIAHPYAFAAEGITGDLGESMSVTDTILLQRNDELSIQLGTNFTGGAGVLIISAQLSAA